MSIGKYVLLLLTLVIGRTLLAQGSVAATTPQPAGIGARVRVWYSAANDLSLPAIGTLTRASRDSIGIQYAPDRAAVGIARQRITHVEVSDGPGTGSRAQSAWIGAGVGGLGGAILGIVVGDITHRNAAKYGTFGFLGLAVGGAAVGANSPGERWSPSTLAHGND